MSIFPEARRVGSVSAQVERICDWTKSQANPEGLGKESKLSFPRALHETLNSTVDASVPLLSAEATR